ncbi:MAG: TonB-dependent receptor [Burkholderiaceae bacterium]|nr:TonB-dependent receptor [Burkholderiaceae bacterium]
MPFPLTRIAMAIALLGAAATALAQQADSKAGGADAASSAAPAAITAKRDQTIQRVEVKADTQAYDPRRDDTASKTILSHEEIIKYGDTNVFDVLKRAPGVTVIGNAIRMRGLGNGYTQILVNGERPPPGFSMDTVTPEQIEKIEVIRAATAEHSMQAIAGTINIVLKKIVSKPQRDLRVNLSHSDEGSNVFMTGTLADRVDNLSYYLNTMLGYNEGGSPSASTDRFLTPQGELVQWRDTVSMSRNRWNMLGLQPRLNWKLPDDEQLNLSGFLQASGTSNDWQARSTNRKGSFGNPDYAIRSSDADNHGLFAGADVNWVVKLGGGKLDAKLAGSRGRNDSDSMRPSATADNVTRLRRDAHNESRYSNYSTIGKYTRTLFDGHAMAAGWEISSNLTQESALRVEGLVGTPAVTTAEFFRPKVVKQAAYAQDEWSVTKDWSVYLGARWEAIRTSSSGSGLIETQSRAQVLSPVAQTLYKFPDQSGRQLRLALTRTFKAPQTNQLTARRYEADLNTRFTPDSSGNPNLKPELANGIDLTYEHFWAPGAVFSVGASQRGIRDYIRTRLIEDRPGHWLSLPMNEGKAMVRTLDVEVKFPLKAFVKEALPFDFRVSANRNWSTVDSVPGPDNRLDQQIPLTVTLGADYREDKFSAGASLAYRGGGMVRQSQQQLMRQQGRRDLEAYWLYKVRTGLQVRLSVNNALGEDNRGESRYVDDRGTSETRSWNAGSARLNANVEMKF